MVLEGKAKNMKIDVQVGRSKIELVNSSIGLQHGHSLLVCGHMKMGRVLLLSISKEVFV